MLPGLLEPGLISDQHPITVAEPGGDVPAQRVPHRILIPAGGVQQPLHPVRGRVPGVLRQGPAVLALQPRRQTQHIRQRPQPRLAAEERRREHLGEHVIKLVQPPGRIDLPYAGHSSRSAIHQDVHTQMITRRLPSRHAATPISKCCCPTTEGNLGPPRRVAGLVMTGAGGHRGRRVRRSELALGVAAAPRWAPPCHAGWSLAARWLMLTVRDGSWRLVWAGAW